MCNTGVGLGLDKVRILHCEKILGGLEGIYLGMEGSGGEIFQGTRHKIDSMKNAIFRSNSCLGDIVVDEFDCVVV